MLRATERSKSCFRALKKRQLGTVQTLQAYIAHVNHHSAVNVVTVWMRIDVAILYVLIAAKAVL